MSEGGSRSAYPDEPPRRGPVLGRAGRRWLPDGTDVLCGDSPDRTEVLFETGNFVVVPDLYPVTPGHMLIYPKRHHPCFATIEPRLERELDAVVARVGAFVRDAYGREPLLWENGGPAAGQSVHHAHLHVMPLPADVTGLPPRQQATDVPPGLRPLRVWWRSQSGGRPYHLVEFRGDRRLVPIGSPDFWALDRFKGVVLDVRADAGGRWVRQRNPLEIARTVALWRRWEMDHPAAHHAHPASPDAGRNLAA